MIVINARGRLAEQPELTVTEGGYQLCKFRLLSNRFSKGAEVLEVVNFVCWGEEAERFAERTVKGQLIEAVGTQETDRYPRNDGSRGMFVQYRLVAWEAGPKPSGHGQANQNRESSGTQQSGGESRGDGQQQYGQRQQWNGQQRQQQRAPVRQQQEEAAPPIF